MESAAGLVISVSGSSATVEVALPIACRRCESGRGCGAGLLTSGNARTIDVTIPAGMTLKQGDAVTLVVDSGHLLRAAMLAYGLPLAGLLLFAALAALVSPGAGEPGKAAFGLLGLLAGLFASRWRIRSSRACGRFVPVIERPAA